MGPLFFFSLSHFLLLDVFAKKHTTHNCHAGDSAISKSSLPNAVSLCDQAIYMCSYCVIIGISYVERLRTHVMKTGPPYHAHNIHSHLHIHKHTNIHMHRLAPHTSIFVFAFSLLNLSSPSLFVFPYAIILYFDIPAYCSLIDFCLLSWLTHVARHEGSVSIVTHKKQIGIGPSYLTHISSHKRTHIRKEK